jgi:hypothetical protein
MIHSLCSGRPPRRILPGSVLALPSAICSFRSMDSRQQATRCAVRSLGRLRASQSCLLCSQLRATQMNLPTRLTMNSPVLGFVNVSTSVRFGCEYLARTRTRVHTRTHTHTHTHTHTTDTLASKTYKRHCMLLSPPNRFLRLLAPQFFINCNGNLRAGAGHVFPRQRDTAAPDSLFIHRYVVHGQRRAVRAVRTRRSLP